VPQDDITLTLDLGGTYTLESAEIVWAGDTIKNYVLSVSTDQQLWTALPMERTRGNAVETKRYSFGAGTAAHYFRIRGLDRWDQTYGNSIFEVRLFGK
jgi:hypothetical protein